jgi:selenoprotein W-related protein
MILRAVPEAQVEGKVGRRSSFEVSINQKQVYSKLASSAFPVFERVVEQVERARKGEEVTEVTEHQESSCQIL